MSFGKFSTVILVRARPYFQESLILKYDKKYSLLPRLLHLKVHFMMQKIHYILFRQNLQKMLCFKFSRQNWEFFGDFLNYEHVC